MRSLGVDALRTLWRTTCRAAGLYQGPRGAVLMLALQGAGLRRAGSRGGKAPRRKREGRQTKSRSPKAEARCSRANTRASGTPILSRSPPCCHLEGCKSIPNRTAMSPPFTACFEIFLPPLGDGDVIDQADRLSSNDAKIAARCGRLFWKNARNLA